MSFDSILVLNATKKSEYTWYFSLIQSLPVSLVRFEFLVNIASSTFEKSYAPVNSLIVAL